MDNNSGGGIKAASLVLPEWGIAAQDPRGVASTYAEGTYYNVGYSLFEDYAESVTAFVQWVNSGAQNGGIYHTAFPQYGNYWAPNQTRLDYVKSEFCKFAIC